MTTLRRFVTLNSLSLFFLVLFLLSVVGETSAGLFAFNAEQAQHGQPTVSYFRYLWSSDFGANMLENWQSEWLQFWVFAVATVWIVQKGSAESKPPGKAGLESDEEQRAGEHAAQNSPRWSRARNWRRRVYENSFLIVMGVVFLSTWLAQSFATWTVFNDEQTAHDDPTVSWLTYVGSSDFWERSLQNWQSEFLAVGTMVVFTVYLRQRGSPESKPVGAPHEETGNE